MFEIIKNFGKERAIKLEVETAISHWNTGDVFSSDSVKGEIHDKLVEKFTNTIINDLTCGDDYEKFKKSIYTELLSRANIKSVIDEKFSDIIKDKLLGPLNNNSHY